MIIITFFSPFHIDLTLFSKSGYQSFQYHLGTSVWFSILNVRTINSYSDCQSIYYTISDVKKQSAIANTDEETMDTHKNFQ